MNCPNCGRRVPDNQDRCVYCGARINTGNRRPIIDSGRTSGPNYIPVIIFLVAVIIALVLLFIIQFRGKSSSQTDSTGTQAASQNNPDPSAGSQSKASDMKAVDTITDETSVGDIVYFGRYEQDNQLDNGSEPIEWIVLDKVDDEFLLITSDIIDEVCYNDVWEETTWADCSLRDWLNGKFLYDAFTDEQRSSIISTTNWNSSGDDTTDKSIYPE